MIAIAWKLGKFAIDRIPLDFDSTSRTRDDDDQKNVSRTYADTEYLERCNASPLRK